jgi:hypothetical protein
MVQITDQTMVPKVKILDAIFDFRTLSKNDIINISLFQKK